MAGIRLVLLLIVCSMLGAIGGAAAGYYSALNTPTVSNIAVLDIEALSLTIDVNSPDYLIKAKALSERVKRLTSQLTAAGMIVLDRNAIVDAPSETIIHVTPD